MIITPQGIEDHQQYEKTEVDIVEQNLKKNLFSNSTTYKCFLPSNHTPFFVPFIIYIKK